VQAMGSGSEELKREKTHGNSFPPSQKPMELLYFQEDRGAFAETRQWDAMTNCVRRDGFLRKTKEKLDKKGKSPSGYA